MIPFLRSFFASTPLNPPPHAIVERAIPAQQLKKPQDVVLESSPEQGSHAEETQPRETLVETATPCTQSIVANPLSEKEIRRILLDRRVEGPWNIFRSIGDKVRKAQDENQLIDTSILQLSQYQKALNLYPHACHYLALKTVELIRRLNQPPYHWHSDKTPEQRFALVGYFADKYPNIHPMNLPDSAADDPVILSEVYSHILNHAMHYPDMYAKASNWEN
jgi:hypothetical protein